MARVTTISSNASGQLLKRFGIGAKQLGEAFRRDKGLLRRVETAGSAADLEKVVGFARNIKMGQQETAIFDRTMQFNPFGDTSQADQIRAGNRAFNIAATAILRSEAQAAQSAKVAASQPAAAATAAVPSVEIPAAPKPAAPTESSAPLVKEATAAQAKSVAIASERRRGRAGTRRSLISLAARVSRPTILGS